MGEQSVAPSSMQAIWKNLLDIPCIIYPNYEKNSDGTYLKKSFDVP